VVVSATTIGAGCAESADMSLSDRDRAGASEDNTPLILTSIRVPRIIRSHANSTLLGESHVETK
jgi:hypothetical protein